MGNGENRPDSIRPSGGRKHAALFPNRGSTGVKHSNTENSNVSFHGTSHLDEPHTWLYEVRGLVPDGDDDDDNIDDTHEENMNPLWLQVLTTGTVTMWEPTSQTLMRETPSMWDETPPNPF